MKLWEANRGIVTTLWSKLNQISTHQVLPAVLVCSLKLQASFYRRHTARAKLTAAVLVWLLLTQSEEFRLRPLSVIERVLLIGRANWSVCSPCQPAKKRGEMVPKQNSLAYLAAGVIKIRQAPGGFLGSKFKRHPSHAHFKLPNYWETHTWAKRSCSLTRCATLSNHQFLCSNRLKDISNSNMKSHHIIISLWK